MKTPWRLYAWIAIIGLAVAIVLGLTACGSDACNGHGGVRVGPVKGWYYCNDGTTQPWSA